MEIRRKLSLQFTLIVAVIQLLLSVTIYISFAKSRIEDMYTRLEEKAASAGQLLIDIEEVDAAVLKKIEQNNPMSLPNEKVIIYDQLNKVLFSNDDQNVLNINSALIDRVRLVNKARSQVNQYEVLGMLYTSPKGQVVVFVAAIDLDGFNKLAFLRLILIIVFFIGLIIVFFAGQIFAGRAIQPILKVIAQVDRIGISNLNARLDEGNNKDEIARLAATFNKLLERLETSFQMQKSFISNASHELNTPLTIITGQLEVVLMKARTNEEYAERITTVLSEIRDLNQLSNKLLLLAQASSELTSTSFSMLRTDDLLWQVRSDLLNRHPGFSIRIELAKEMDDEDQLIVSGNGLLLKTAFANIVENGCKYSDNHNVDINLSREYDSLVIHFIDQGAGIPEKELTMIFQPFYRSRSAKNNEGHGIGLSLAEKVITLHRGTLTVTSQVGIGSDFVIRLPLTKQG
jgi:signal transduction histidine kinase